MLINTSIDLTRFKTPAKKSELTDKELQDHIIKSPTKKQHNDAFSMGRAMLKVPEAEKNKMAEEWMRSGGREKGGRSLDEEIKLGKEEWLKSQRVAKKPKPKPILPEWDWREGVWFDLQDVDPYYDWKPKPPEEETKIRMPERRYGIASLIKK